MLSTVNKWHLAGGRYFDHERLLSKNTLDAKAVVAGDVSKELLERLSNEHRQKCKSTIDCATRTRVVYSRP